MPDLEEQTTDATQVVAPPPTPAVEATPDDFDKERALKTIRDQRQIEKDLRAQLKELDALKAEKQQRDLAEMTDLERARAEYAALQAQHSTAQAALQEARVKDAARNAAQTLSLQFQPGALEDAVKLGLFSTLEFTEDGKPKGMNDALKQLQKERPHYFAQASGDDDDIGATRKGKALSGPDIGGLSRRWGIKVE